MFSSYVQQYPGFIRVMEKLENHGILQYHFFQAWKVMEFECGSWKVMENDY